MRLLLLIQVIIFASISFAQGEDNYWYFGEEAGLNFNTTPPTVLTDGEMNSLEAVDTVSDADGNLLFYTSGFWVWNKEHEIMPNGTGLDGSGNSTCVAIVKKPGVQHLYYIFTIGDDFGQDTGLKYSVVNMTLDDGLGDVTEKNLEVRGNVFEKILIVPHSNQTDFWIICFENVLGQNDYLHSHLLTSEGLSESSVTNSIDIDKSPSGALVGEIIVSSNFNQVALAFTGHGLGVFDFNAEIGTLELSWFFEDFPPWGFNFAPKVYGLEFSTSAQFLYVSHRVGASAMTIYQIDLSNLPSSAGDLVSMGEFSAFFEPNLQMAPNGKIYSAAPEREYIHVIHFPDLVYPFCQFEIDAVYLEGKLSQGGLPPRKNFPTQSPIQIENVCIGDSTQFFIDNLSSTADSVVWNFGDTLSLENLAIGNPVVHQYSEGGTYQAHVWVYSGESEYPLSTKVIISEVPDLSFLSDQLICSGEDSLIITHPLDLENVSWNDSINSDTLVINEIGFYSFQANNNGCIVTGAFQVTENICDLYAFDIYPNPAIGNVRIDFSVPSEYTKYYLLFHDSAGRLVKSVELSGLNESHEFSIAELSSGIYSISFLLDGKIHQAKSLLITK